MDSANDSVLNSDKQEPEEISEIIDSNLLELYGSDVIYQKQEESTKKNPVKRKGYVCRKCGRKFTDRMTWKGHEKSWSRLFCEICDDEFQCRFGLVQHIQQNHENETKCRKCPFVGKDLKALRGHCYRHKIQPLALQPLIEVSDTHACRKCGLEFGTRKDFREHQSQMGNFKCLLCDEEFECEHARSQHLEKDHEEDIDQLSTLQHKEQSELDVAMKFECDHCGLTFDTRRKLVLHMNDHFKFSFSCDGCGARFSRLKNLTIHRKNYSGNFWCENNCDKVFKCRRALNIHIRKDHKDLWKCPECPAVFTTMKQLQAHRDKQHNNKFQCDLCELAFLKERTLWHHKWRFHGKDMDNSQYSCDECGKKFWTQENLRKHKMQTDHQIFQKQNQIVNENSSGSFVDPKRTPKKSRTVTETLNFGGLVDELASYSIKEEPENAFPDIKIHPKVAENKQGMSSEINNGLETVVKHEQEESPLVAETLAMNIHVKEKPDVYNLLEMDGSVEEEPEEFQLLEELEQKTAIVNNLPFSCEYCGARFKRKSGIRMHQNNISTGMKYKCRVEGCVRTFFCMQQRFDHIELFHPPDPSQTWKCSECSFTASTSQGLRVHSSTHKPKHRCDQCSQSFVTRTRLNYHKDIHHKHACSMCGLQFLTRKDFKEHQSQMGSFKCLLCEQEFECESARSQHLGRDHEECLSCPKCPYIDKDLSELARHCEDNHEFQLAALQHQAHLEKLEAFDGKMKFECDHCGLSFAKKRKLFNHMIHHLKFAYSCDDCGAKFSRLEHLIIHRQNDLVNFRCKKVNCFKMCNKVFKCKRALTAHVRKDHEEIWKCPECPAVFKTKKQRQVHRNKQHNKKFQCDLCELSFLKHRALRTHKWSFHQLNVNQKFSCDKCEKKFKTRNELRKHEILAHPDPQTKNKYLLRLQRNQKPQFAFVSVDSSESIVPKQEQEESSTVSELWDEKYDFQCHSMATSTVTESLTSYEGHMEELVGYSIKEEPEYVTPDIKIHPMVPAYKQEMTSETYQGLETVVKHEEEDFPLVTETLGMNIHVKEEPDFYDLLEMDGSVEEEPEDLNVLESQLLEELEQKDGSADYSPISCQHCGTNFNQKSQLRNHQFNKSKLYRAFMKYKCFIGKCKKSFSCKQQRDDHIELHHPPSQPQNLNCSKCSFTASNSNGLKTHSLIHKPTMHRCDQCSRSFETWTLLISHRDSHHKHACSKCGFQFETRKDFREHQSQMGNFKCLLCDKEFECEYARSQHLERDHEKDINQLSTLQHKESSKLETFDVEIKFECDHCGLSFDKRRKLLNHMIDHVKFDFSCDGCGAKFSLTEHLINHQKIYSGSFKCIRKNCTEVFKCKRALNKHIRKDHGEIWKCPECPAVFKTKNKRKVHRNEQHNEKFQCDLCELSFLKHRALRTHKWSFHQLNRTEKFSCDKCGEKFKTKGHLRKHDVLEHLKPPKKKPKKNYKSRLQSNQNAQFSFVSADLNGSIVPKQERKESSTVTFEGHIEKLAGYSIKEEPENALTDIEIHHSTFATNEQEISSETNQGLDTAAKHEQEESPSVTETLHISIHVKEESEVSYVLKFPSEEEEF